MRGSCSVLRDETQILPVAQKAVKEKMSVMGWKIW